MHALCQVGVSRAIFTVPAAYRHCVHEMILASVVGNLDVYYPLGGAGEVRGGGYLVALKFTTFRIPTNKDKRLVSSHYFTLLTPRHWTQDVHNG